MSLQVIKEEYDKSIPTTYSKYEPDILRNHHFNSYKEGRRPAHNIIFHSIIFKKL